MKLVLEARGTTLYNLKKSADEVGIGTLQDPIVVRSAGDELQVGCTGCPADSHIVRWLVVSDLMHTLTDSNWNSPFVGILTCLGITKATI